MGFFCFGMNFEALLFEWIKRKYHLTKEQISMDSSIDETRNSTVKLYHKLNIFISNAKRCDFDLGTVIEYQFFSKVN